MPRLVTPEGHSLTLPPRRVSVGEGPANEIPIAPGNGVAAVHFRLQPWASGYFIEDAGSGLGTLVNGQAVTRAPLQHGDVITAGRLKMIYEADALMPVPEFPSGAAAAAWKQLPVVGPAPAATEPAPPSWLPPEALLPPLTPVAQAAARRSTQVSGNGPRWRFPVFLLLAAAAMAAWYFFRR